MKKLLVTYDYNQSPFYRLKTRKKLAALLNIAPEDLNVLQGLNSTYRRAWLHKKTKIWRDVEPTPELESQYRPIDLPDDRLKSAQKIIATHMSKVVMPDNVYSPVKRRSYVDNAKAHLGAASIYSMDIDSYFPSTTKTKIVGFFRNVMLCPPDVALILANLVTKDESLPQGSPCSPIIAYHANRGMWDEVTSIIQDYDCHNTIYADDLTISGAVVPRKLVYLVKAIIKKHGLSVNAAKDKSSYRRASRITGVIVKDGKLMLPNSQHQMLRDAGIEVSKARNPKEREKAENRLRSRRAQRRQIEMANENEPK